MVKHPTSRRVHREAHDEDAFVAGVVESSVWARNHQRILTIVGVVVVLGLVLGLYYRNYRVSHANDAASQLSAVRQTVMQGNHQLAMRDLKQYLAKYGNTASGDEARLMLAQVQMEEGQPQSAITTLKPLAGNPGKSEGATAALMLGAAYEAAKQYDNADQTYDGIASKARFGFEKREALDRAANLAIQRGNTARAAELYEKAMNTLPTDSEERPIYQMRIAEVQAAGAKTGS